MPPKKDKPTTDELKQFWDTSIHPITGWRIPRPNLTRTDDGPRRKYKQSNQEE